VSSVYDLAVIGSGMAGLSASIQGARMGLRTIVIGEVVTGGQIANTELVENYPGFAGGCRA
jgi:thioredoxin reductase (NADPH)